MTNLNWVFGFTLVLAMGIGAYRGWLPQALSMLGFFVAFLGVIYVGPWIARHLPLSGPGEPFRDDVGALLALLVTLYVAHLGVRLHKHIFTHNGVQPAHRSLGAVFGLISGMLVCLAMGSLIELTELRDQDWWRLSLEKNITTFVLEHLSKSVKT
ncbi:MAG: CvpA family protein [Betaproteobacteria bacterium]|jgi:membrane protein required for colicin V production|nr:CvpA family protein [Betaproteobacteria bacterium]